MENSKLFSNEPLRILKSHIEDLRRLHKKEQEKSAKLKRMLKKIQDLWKNKKKIEVGRILDSLFSGQNSLNDSLLNVTGQIAGFTDAFDVLGKIVKERIRSVVKVIACKGFEEIEADKKCKKYEFNAKVLGICLKNLRWKRVWTGFQTLRCTNKRQKLEKKPKKLLKGTNQKQITELNRKKKLKLEFVFRILERKVKELKELCLNKLKPTEENQILFEQGLNILSTSLTLYIKREIFTIFKSNPRKSTLSHQIVADSLTAFVHAHQKSLLSQSFSSLSYTKSIKIIYKDKKVTVPLNPVHHHLSQKLLTIAKIPSLITKSLIKSSFLSIVSYVSFHISYDMLEKNLLQRMSEIFKSFTIKKTLKYFNAWKNSELLELSMISTKNFMLEKKSDPQVRRSCFINLNLIVQRLQSANKSQAFMMWQELKDFQVEFKENYRRVKEKGKKNKVPVLRLNQNVSNIYK